MSVRVEVLDPRTDAEPPRWADFRAATQLHAPWDFGLLGIESRHARHPAVLAVASQDGEPVAALAATVGRARGLRWAEVHNPWLSGFPGIAFAESLATAARREVLRALERAVRRWAGFGCAGLLYRYLPAATVPVVAGRGRVVRPATGTSILDNSFASAEDWIAALPRSRRHSIRGQVRKIERDPDLDVRFAPVRTDLDAGELATLLNRHRARLGRPRFDSRSEVAAEYLHALVRRPDVWTLTYHDGAGRLLAFADLLDHPAVPLYQHWAALPRDEGGRAHLYFDSYVRMVRMMVDGNRKSLSAGRGRLELKASLGLQTSPLWIAAVPRWSR